MYFQFIYILREKIKKQTKKSLRLKRMNLLNIYENITYMLLHIEFET